MLSAEFWQGFVVGVALVGATVFLAAAVVRARGRGKS